MLRNYKIEKEFTRPQTKSEIRGVQVINEQTKKKNNVDRNIESLKDDDGNFLTDKTQTANGFDNFFSTIPYQVSASLHIDFDKSNGFLERTERPHSTFDLPTICYNNLKKNQSLQSYMILTQI